MRNAITLTASRYKAWIAAIAVGLVLIGGLLVASSAGAQHGEAPHGEAPHGEAPHGGIPGATVQTHHEVIPNPVHESDFSVADQCQGAAAPCDWGNASTWRTGTVPGPSTRVIVDGYVTIRSQDAVARSVGVYPGGKLTFGRSVNTKLTTADLVVFDAGTLHVGTSTAPIDGDVQAEIVFRNIAFDSSDPTQILRGLVAPGGTVKVSGSPLSDTYLRAAAEPARGSNTITTVESMSAAGWSVGDTVTIPTSRQCFRASEECRSQTEDRTIVAISDRTATLNAPLTYDHPGGQDHNGQIDFMPHVINKTRNVIFRSEDPNGVRGHMLFHGRVDVDVRYAEVRDMGRTNIQNLGSNNQKGRYPVHAHHLIGPRTAQANGYQFTLIGNSVDFGEENVSQGRKWGISIHGSHFGLIERNSVDRASGAAIVTESGEEMGNMLRENFVVRVVGGNGERLEDIDPSDGSKSGRAGVGYWFNGGGRNSFRNNIATDVFECIWCFGFKVDNVRAGDLLFPTVQGSDPLIDGGEVINGNSVSMNDFVGNEAYGLGSGMTVWWQCAIFETPIDGCSTQIDALKVWNHHRYGYYGYETNNLTLANFVMRGDEEALSNKFTNVRGLDFSDYMQRNLVISNADIQGMRTGIRMPAFRDVRNATGPNDGVTIVEDSFIVATEGLGIWASFSVNGSASDLSAQTSVVRNVRFDYPQIGAPEDVRGHIVMRDTSLLGDDSKTNYAVRNDVRVENYNGAPGADFYIVPGYQGPGRCDANIANCALEVTSRFDNITQGRIFALRGDTNGPVDGGGPSVPAPVDPAPVDPAPVDPAPVDPAPVDPAPVDPAPVDPAPVDPAPVDPAPVFPPGAPNLVANGSFDTQLDPWFSWSLDFSHEAVFDNGQARMTHVNSSGRNFSQLFQEIGRVEGGESYRLRFDIRSNRTGEVGVLFQQAGPPWARLTDPEVVSTYPTSRSVEVVLRANVASAATTLMFQLEDDAQTIWVDNVELVKAGAPGDGAPDAVNVLNNGSFTSELDPWFGYSLEHNVQLSVDNGQLRMAHVNASGRNFSQISQRIGRVEAGQTYRLRFDVRSSRSNGDVHVLFEQAKSPWARLTVPLSVQVGQTTRSVEVVLTTTTTSAETKFMFQLRNDDQTIWVDNVELVAIQ